MVEEKRFNMGLNPIKDLRETSSGDYFKRTLFQKEEKFFKYSKKRVAIGIKRDGSPLYITCDEGFRIFILGMTGSGKTFLMRGILDRLKKINFAVIFLTDVKAEFGSSTRPVQEKFRHMLLEGEKPKGIPMVVLRPTFFQSLQGKDSELPEKNIWYSERFEDLEEIDFKSLLDADSLTINQKIGIELIWEFFKRHKGMVLEDVNEIIDTIDEFNNTQKTALKFKFRPLIKANIFDPEHQLNIIDAIKSGLAVSVNMQGFENFGRGNGFPQVIVGMFLRKIINARRAKQIPEVIVAIDEMSRFVPREGGGSCKLEVTESYDVDRRFAISYCSASQSLFDVPEKILKQSRWVFIPYNVDMGELKFALKICGIMKNIQSLNNEAVRLKGRLKKFDWICIDRNTNQIDIFSPLAPLSEHSEVDKS